MCEGFTSGAVESTSKQHSGRDEEPQSLRTNLWICRHTSATVSNDLQEMQDCVGKGPTEPETSGRQSTLPSAIPLDSGCSSNASRFAKPRDHQQQREVRGRLTLFMNWCSAGIQAGIS